MDRLSSQVTVRPVLRLDCPRAGAGTGIASRLLTLHQAPYENLHYTAGLAWLDGDGRRAVFHKQQRVRFLQNHVIAFEDYAWGDGDILSHYRCAPGVVMDRYREGDRWNILISLREIRQRGDIVEFHIERTERNSFMRGEEWLQTEIRRPTSRLQMRIVFPAAGHCRRAVLLQRNRNRVTMVDPEHFHLLPDGRQLVS